MSINPYASPSEASSVAQASGAEDIRRQYLSHEASVKSIGTLYLLGGIVLVPIGFVMMVSIFSKNEAGFFVAVLGAGYVALGTLQLATAIGLRRLQPWARVVGVLFSVIGLLGIPIGTIISVYILYLLLSKKGSFVFSDEYRRVVAATPHIKYRTSIIVILFLAILVILLLGGIAALLFGK